MTVRELMGKLTSMVIANPAVGDSPIESVGLTVLTKPPASNNAPQPPTPSAGLCSCLQYRQTKNCDHLKAKLKELES